MKDQFVTYEIAKRLKEFGFDSECFGYYYRGDIFAKSVDPMRGIWLNDLSGHGDSYLAPLWQQAVYWLRVEHNTHVLITPPDGIWKYLVEIKFFGYKDQNGGTGYRTYEQAREAAILKALQLIK